MSFGKYIRKKRSCFLNFSPPHPAIYDYANNCLLLIFLFSFLLKAKSIARLLAYTCIYMYILWDPAEELTGSSRLRRLVYTLGRAKTFGREYENTAIL